jgi:predicted RNA binding protein YcfA (HicA-like mRNA interferase family)
MKVRDVIRMLERDAWRQVAQHVSHRQFRHPVKQGRANVAGNPGQELAPGTLASILGQSCLSREDR